MTAAELFRIDLDELTILPPFLSLAERLQQTLNSSYALHSQFMTWPKPSVTTDECRLMLGKSIRDFESVAGERKFYILHAQSQNLIGCIGFKPCSRSRKCRVGYWVNADYAGKGYMRKALAVLITRHTFPRFYLTTSSGNTASQRLATRVGFELIRVLRNHRTNMQGLTEDTLIYRLVGVERTLIGAA